MRKLWWKVGLPMCAAALLLSACGDKLPPAPETYELNGEAVPSLNEVLGEENSGTMTEMETAEDQPDGDASQPDALPSGQAGDMENQYVYEKLSDCGNAVSQYVDELTSGDSAFAVVDKEGEKTSPPDYTAESGSVILARDAPEDGKLLKMEISWTSEECRIVMTYGDGAVKTEPADPMTNTEAVEYIEGLSPTELGLTGTSMKDYRIYPVDGLVMVNGVACLKLQVYQMRQASHTNQIAGVFLLSGDKTHLYRLDNGEITEVHIL